MPVGNATGDILTSWLHPLSLATGALFVATGAYLSSVFLVSDARRAGAADLERYFGDRAIVAALVAGALAVVGLIALRADARSSSMSSRAMHCHSSSSHSSAGSPCSSCFAVALDAAPVPSRRVRLSP